MKLTSLFLSTALTLFAVGITYAGPLEVGEKAPTTKTVDQDGEEVDLGKEFKEGITLIYFYPKAHTGGCTKQACNLRDAFADVEKAGIKVFGVSADQTVDQKSFAEKFKLPFKLLADTEGAVIKGFGVPTNQKGFPSRQSFLVKDGKIIWRDLKATPTTQAEDAIAAAKEHG